ncbi:MAG: hypothetical protein AB7T59_00025 [Hyphomonadaceae bacterium]
MHALNHVLGFGLSMADRRLPSMMHEKHDVFGGRKELTQTVDAAWLHHWMETELRPYLRHGVLPGDYPAVHNAVAATSRYLAATIPDYADPDSEKIHALTLKALITLMALQSIGLVIGSKDVVMTTTEEAVTRVEAHKELNRWVSRLETLDERVKRHNVARADNENHPFSDISLEFLGHEERFASLRVQIADQLARMR